MEAPDSDHSLTWEDFFGSTTDLTPTLIGIFDSFLEPPAKSVDSSVVKTTKREDGKRKMAPPVSSSPSKDPRLMAGSIKLPGFQSEESLVVTQPSVKSSPLPKMSYVSRLKSFGLKRSNACDIKEGGDQVVKEPEVADEKVSVLNPTISKINSEIVAKAESNRKQWQEKSGTTNGNSFDNLSPNVKRMLSSVGADESCSKTVTQPKKQPLAGIGRSSYRLKQSNIPLIGTTSKITQSGVEVISTADIYDKPSSSLTKINVKPGSSTKDWSTKTLSSFSPEKKEQKTEQTEESSAVYDVPPNSSAIYDVPNGSRRVSEVIETNDIQTAEPVKTISVTIEKANTPVVPKVNSSFLHPKASGSTGDLARLNLPVIVTRPLSMSSIASSSSTSSSGAQNKGGANSAYLASIESLDDHSDAEYAKNPRINQAPGIILANDTAGKTTDTNLQPPGRPPTPPRPRYCDPSLSQLERVCTEIVDTENVYVEDLRQVVEGYLYTWREKGTFATEQLKDLFSNIEEIYHFNKEFSQHLNECNLEAVAIAKCFVNHSTGFGIYTQYCTGYPGTMAALTRLVGAPDSAQPFRAQQAMLGHALPLGSYLLKPVQRILKYHLLLQNLVKQCKSHETEYALHKMTGIAHHINDMKRRHEHAVRVQEIQSLLYGWNGQDLTTFGELCAEGTFRVFGAKALRHAFLFDKMLLLTKNKEYGMLAYKSHIMCNNLMLVESIQGQPLSFHVIPFDCPRMQVTLQARSIQHKREWTLLLKRVILENYNAVIPSHARQLVMELGQNKTDDDMLAEKSNTLISHSSMRKQMSAPEYLEKRKVDRDRRKSFESGLRYRLKRSATRKEPSYDSLAENEETEKEQNTDGNSIFHEEFCMCHNDCNDYRCVGDTDISLCSNCKNICDNHSRSHDCKNNYSVSDQNLYKNCSNHKDSNSSNYKCNNCHRVNDEKCSCAISEVECSNCHKSISVINDVKKDNPNCSACNHSKVNNQLNASEDDINKNCSSCHKCNHSKLLHEKNILDNTKNKYDRLAINDTNNQINDLRKTCLRCHDIRENITIPNEKVTDSCSHESNSSKRPVSKDDMQTLSVSKVTSQRRKSEPGISSINIDEIKSHSTSMNSNIDNSRCENCVRISLSCKTCGKTLPKSKKSNCVNVNINLSKNEEQLNMKKDTQKNVSIEVKMYNSKTVPKKISKIKKNRAKTLRQRALDPTAKFYTDFSSDLTDNVLHISESTDSINTLNSQKNYEEEKKLTENTKIPDGIDEETYKSLIQKTDSFKKSEIERDKLSSQSKQFVSDEKIESDVQNSSEAINGKASPSNSTGDLEEDAFESCDDGQNEKPLEVIISQLLMQNREFQKILKRHQLRNATNRRHQRLLKSHSNPEKALQQVKDGLIKVRPKYGRQTSAIETDSHMDLLHNQETSEKEENNENLTDLQEEHIYETLMVTSQKLIDKSKSSEKSPPSKIATSTPKSENKCNSNSISNHCEGNVNDSGETNRTSVPEPDYVYLCFDGKKNVDAYKLPDNMKISINFEDSGLYAVPNASPKKASLDIIEKRVVNHSEHDYHYENASEIWKRISNDTVIENKAVKGNKNINISNDCSDTEGGPQSPNLPEIWLDRQKEHFGIPRGKKSGSLPRSFQLVLNNAELDSPKFQNKPGAFNKVYLNKEGKVLHSDRPFTIASDRSEISYEDIERFIKTNDNSVLKFPQDSLSSNRSSIVDESVDDTIDSASRSTLELEAEIERCYKNKFGFNHDQLRSALNNSLNSLQMRLMNRSISSSMEVMDDKRENETSQEEITTQSVHPEHRIYKPNSNILSLKGVLNRFKSKIRSSQENINSEDFSPESKQNASKKVTSPKNHPRNLLQRFISTKSEEQTIPDYSTSNEPIIASDPKNKNANTTVKVIIDRSDDLFIKNQGMTASKSFYQRVVSNCEDTSESVSKSCNNISLGTKTQDSKVLNMSQSAQFSPPMYNSAIVNKAAKSIQDLNKLPIYKQGSRHLGARIAQSDYADPKILKINSNSELNKVNILINKNALRPDSLLSNSSHFTSSSEGCITANVDIAKNNSFLYRSNSNNNNPTDEVSSNVTLNSDSDKNGNKISEKYNSPMNFKLSSDDSFYEKSFEEIEHILDNEIFRDSAIYSDPEDGSFCLADEKVLGKKEINSKLKPLGFYNSSSKISNFEANNKAMIQETNCNTVFVNYSEGDLSKKLNDQVDDIKIVRCISVHEKATEIDKLIEDTNKPKTNTKGSEDLKANGEIEPKCSKLAPPVPVKPIISRITMQNIKTTNKRSTETPAKNSQETKDGPISDTPNNNKSLRYSGIQISQNISRNSIQEDTVDKTEPSKLTLTKPGIPRPNFNRSTSSNITMKRMSFERSSLDSSMLNRRSKSVSAYKADSAENTMSVEEITITKSVQERRKEIEMMAQAENGSKDQSKTDNGDRLSSHFTRSVSFKMNSVSSGLAIAKIQSSCTKTSNICKPALQKSNSSENHESSIKLSQSSESVLDKVNDNAKGGWVKHVVNRFQ